MILTYISLIVHFVDASIAGRTNGVKERCRMGHVSLFAEQFACQLLEDETVSIVLHSHPVIHLLFWSIVIFRDSHFIACLRVQFTV